MTLHQQLPHPPSALLALKYYGELVHVSGCGWTYPACPSKPGRGYYVPTVAWGRAVVNKLVAQGHATWHCKGPNTDHATYQLAVEAAVTWQAGKVLPPDPRYPGITMRASGKGARRAQIVVRLKEAHERRAVSAK